MDMTTLIEVLVSLMTFSFFLFNGKKANRYLNWYRPWLLFILILLNLGVFEYLKYKYEEIKLLPVAIQELGLCIGVILEWAGVKMLLQIFNVNKHMEKFLKEYNVNKVLEKTRGYDNHLTWPYIKIKDRIYYRAGYKFFKTLLWTAVIIIILFYIVIAILISKGYFETYTLISALSISVFLEFIIYFGYKAIDAPRAVNLDENGNTEVNFQGLFKRYTHKENGFLESIIFGFIRYAPIAMEGDEKEERTYLDNYIDKFKNQDIDLVIGSNNFTDAIPQVTTVVMDTLKKGGNVLLIADIPVHTSYRPISVGIQSEDQSERPIAALFGIYLQQLLEHQIPSARNLLEIGFFSSKDNSGLKKRIVLCSIEDSISDELIHSDWMKELDLKIVFQFNDSYANNLGAKREFSLWLEQLGRDYKSIFFQRYSTGGDEATSNTWISTKDVPEVNMQNIQTATANYYINFAFEYCVLNLNKVLIGNTNEYDLAPGIELSVFPIMENVDHIHYFEGYSLDYIQSKNKLESLQRSFWQGQVEVDDFYNYHKKVTQTKLLNSILINNLPFVIHPFGHSECNAKHLSVIFDSENNAPKLYQKYKHLGSSESFICIISKPHLFREYFAYNVDYFVNSTIEPFEPLLSKSKINLCLQLFNLLINEHIDLEFIKSQLNAYSIELKNQSVVDFIKELFRKYLHLDVSKNAILKSGNKFVFKNGDYYDMLTLSMDSQNMDTNEIFDYLNKVKIVDNSGNLILETPKYLLFQNFLPQQNIIIDGISYDYIQYNNRNKELVLKTKPTDNYSFNKANATIRAIQLEKIKLIDTEENNGVFIDGKMRQFSTGLYETEMEIFYTGYYQFQRFYYSPFSPKQTPTYIDLASIPGFVEESTRKYNTRFLHIKWEVGDQYSNKVDELTTKLHHLIYEFLPVLFPHRHQYIQIASNNEYKKGHREKTPWIFPENNFEFTAENKIELYFIEDSFVDLGTLNPIQTYFKKILIDLYFFLKWIDDKEACIPNTYSEYVEGKINFKDRHAFLKYGLDDKLIHWDIPMLIQFLENCKLFDVSVIGEGYKKMCSKPMPEKTAKKSQDKSNQPGKLNFG